MAAPVVVVEVSTGPDYVSRGAHKLVGALHRFDPDGQMVVGRWALDAGASTRDAAANVATALHVPKRRAYSLAVALR